MAYYQLEPWGTDVEMYGHAMTTATLINTHRDPKKNPVAVKPSDVMPRWDTSGIVEEQLNQVKQLNNMFGGTEEKRVDHS